MARKRKNPAAVALGRKGGQARSEAKTRAARLNGLKGVEVRKRAARPLPTPERQL